MIQICSKCLVSKSELEFYSSEPRRCKTCVRERGRRYKVKNLLSHRLTDKLYRKRRRSEKRPEDIEYKRRYKKEHRDAIKAHVQVFWALRLGTLKRLPCEKCGEVKTQGHHTDYSKPLDVKWLCASHHKLEHISSSGRF